MFLSKELYSTPKLDISEEPLLRSISGHYIMRLDEFVVAQYFRPLHHAA